MKYQNSKYFVTTIASILSIVIIKYSKMYKIIGQCVTIALISWLVREIGGTMTALFSVTFLNRIRSPAVMKRQTVPMNMEEISSGVEIVSVLG